MRTAADLSAYGFAVGAVGGGTWQHRVFGGDPAQAGILAPTRYAGGEGGGAHHACIAAFDEYGTFRNVRETAGNANRTQFVHLAPVRTNHGLLAQHVFNRYHCTAFVSIISDFLPRDTITIRPLALLGVTPQMEPAEAGTRWCPSVGLFRRSVPSERRFGPESTDYARMMICKR